MTVARTNHKFKNYVQKDGVVKEHENFVRAVRNRDAWKDFDINKVKLEVAKEEGFTEQEYKQLARSCSKNQTKLTANDWKLQPCQKYPRTTAGEVGWRHYKAYHNLELYGKLYKSPKLTMMPLYEPAEVIFLG